MDGRLCFGQVGAVRWQELEWLPELCCGDDVPVQGRLLLSVSVRCYG